MGSCDEVPSVNAFGSGGTRSFLFFFTEEDRQVSGMYASAGGGGELGGDCSASWREPNGREKQWEDVWERIERSGAGNGHGQSSAEGQHRDRNRIYHSLRAGRFASGTLRRIVNKSHS